MNIFELLCDHTVLVVVFGSALLGMVSGLLGTFSVLRRQSLLGDGVSHAALPGVAAAFLLTGTKDSGTLLLGALLSGLTAAGLIFSSVKKSKVKFDAALATVMSSFFGLGTVLLTCAQKLPNATQAGLHSFIYGQASSMLGRDALVTIICGGAILAVVLLLWKEIKVFVFDRDFALQLGIPCGRINLILSFLTVLGVIIGIQTVGVVLMSAMLIAPAAAARQWCDKLWLMAVLSALFGGIAGAAGALAGALAPGIPTGPSIVIAASALAVFSLLFAPKRGVLYRIYLRHKAMKKEESYGCGN